MNKKNKKTIIIITFLSIILILSLAFVLKDNIIKLTKLKSSVSDPITGSTCTSEIDADSIYSNSSNDNVYNKINTFIEESASHCNAGYKCQGKPEIESTADTITCESTTGDNVNTSGIYGFDSMVEYYVDGLVPNNTIEDVLKNLRTIYNSDFYCQQSNCAPRIYEIELDKNGGTGGTDKIYEKYDVGFYSDEEAEDYLSNIEVPTITYTVTYDDNGTGATFSDSTAVVNGPFDGYYRDTDYESDFSNYYECDSHFYNYSHDEYEENYNYNDLSTYDSLIESDGRINMSSNSFPHYHECKGDKLFANYTHGLLESQSITKPNYTCYWKKLYNNDEDEPEYGQMESFECDSADGYCYSSESDIPIKGDTTLYAECYKNPELTVINYTCDENGDNCNEYSRNSYIKEYGIQETIYPNSISGYSTPDGATVTYNGDHTLKFYYTKNNTYPNYGQGTYNSNYVISQNSNNSAMTISPNSGITNANYVAIYSVAANGQDYKWNVGAGVTDNFQFSHFTSTGNQSSNGVGYGAPSNGQYGIYYASFLAREGDNDSWRDVYGGNAGNAIIRPYIRVIHMDDIASYGSTQVKTRNSTIRTYSAPSKSGYTFKAWQAMSKTSNSTGVTNAPLTACTQGNSNVYYPANYTINATSWNLSNQSYPCPATWGYVDNIMTVYLYAVWQRNPWYSLD